MTPSQAARVLGIAAGFDNRQVTPETATLWAAELRGITPDEAEEAVLRHFKHSNEYLRPAHIWAQVKVIRREIARETGTGTYAALPAHNGRGKPAWFDDAVRYYANAYANGLTPATVADYVPPAA